jgi:hypothetical protein
MFESFALLAIVFALPYTHYSTFSANQSRPYDA